MPLNQQQAQSVHVKFQNKSSGFYTQCRYASAGILAYGRRQMGELVVVNVDMFQDGQVSYVAGQGAQGVVGRVKDRSTVGHFFVIEYFSGELSNASGRPS